MHSELPTPSKAGQAAHGPGKTPLSSGPIYFNSYTATSCCLAARSPGTQWCAEVMLGSHSSVLNLGWSGSFCSVVLPPTATPCREL